MKMTSRILIWNRFSHRDEQNWIKNGQLDKNSFLQTTSLLCRSMLPFYLLQSTRSKFLISFSKLEKEIFTEVSNKTLICSLRWRGHPFEEDNLVTGKQSAQCNAECCLAQVMCSLTFTNKRSQGKAYVTSQWHISPAWPTLPCAPLNARFCFLQEQYSGIQKTVTH